MAIQLCSKADRFTSSGYGSLEPSDRARMSARKRTWEYYATHGLAEMME